MMRSTPRFFAHLSLIAALAACRRRARCRVGRRLRDHATNPEQQSTACIDVKGADTASGTPIESYPCSGFFNEQWTLDRVRY